MNQTEKKLRQMYLDTAKSIVAFARARHFGRC
jgi:hypothetical protein